MNKPAPTDHPVHDLIRDRWSPRAFGTGEVAQAQIDSMIEAARWAASCYNGQPWRYVVGTQGSDTYRKIFDALVPFNQGWAQAAPVLILAVAKLQFDDGRDNGHATYDTGQATAQLVLQATDLGLRVHQMAGFDADKARAAFEMPDGFQPIAVLAVGQPGDPSSLPEDLQGGENAPRERKPGSALIYDGTWS